MQIWFVLIHLYHSWAPARIVKTTWPCFMANNGWTWPCCFLRWDNFVLTSWRHVMFHLFLLKSPDTLSLSRGWKKGRLPSSDISGVNCDSGTWLRLSCLEAIFIFITSAPTFYYYYARRTTFNILLLLCQAHTFNILLLLCQAHNF